MHGRLFFTLAVATFATAAQAEIYRCTDTRHVAFDTFVRLDGSRMGTALRPEQGWVDACHAEHYRCRINRRGRVEIGFFEVDAGGTEIFDRAKLRLVRRGFSTIGGSTTRKFNCARLAAEEEARLSSPWKSGRQTPGT